MAKCSVLNRSTNKSLEQDTSSTAQWSCWSYWHFEWLTLYCRHNVFANCTCKLHISISQPITTKIKMLQYPTNRIPCKEEQGSLKAWPWAVNCASSTQLGVVHGRPKFSVIQENLLTATTKHNHQKGCSVVYLQCCHYLTTALMTGSVAKW
jgi:hypothetical protein